jgi:hypothetical protein
MKAWVKAAVQGAACGLMLGLVLLIGGRLWRPQIVGLQAGQPAVTDLVRTKRLELVDERGKVRAVLDMAGKAPLGLHLRDAAGNLRASLDLLGDDPALGLWGAAGKALVSLTTSRLVVADAAGMAHLGSSKLTLGDAAGKTRASLDLTPDGSPNLSLKDAAGNVRTALIVHFNGSPTMGLFDAAGKLVWLAP